MEEQAPAGDKAAQADRDNRCLSASGQHDISIPAANVIGCCNKGIIGSGAGRADAVIRAHEAAVNGYQCTAPAKHRMSRRWAGLNYMPRHVEWTTRSSHISIIQI